MHADNCRMKIMSLGFIILVYGLLLTSTVTAATPIFTGCPDYLNGSHCDSIYFQVVAADTSTTGNRNNIRYHLIQGPGEIDERTGLWQFHPELEPIPVNDRDPLIEIAASIGNDTTHGYENCRFYAGVQNRAPSIYWSRYNLPSRIEPGEIYEVTVLLTETDECDTAIFLDPTIRPEPYGLFEFDKETGELTFAPTEEDRGYLYTITLRASDGINDSFRSLAVEVGEPAPIEIRIENTHGSLPGSDVIVNVYINPKRSKLERFDFLIGYNAEMLNLRKATMDGSPFKENCDWDYFYSSKRSSDCEGPDCPTGLYRFTGQRDIRNSPDTDCDLYDTEQLLFSMTFRVTSSPCASCTFQSLRFFWEDCSSNRMIVTNYMRTYYSKTVKDHDFDMTGIEDIGPADDLLTFKGAPESCITNGRTIRRLDFLSGGLDVVCADSAYSLGDFDLDGLGYTRTDAQIFANYFTIGNDAFEICESFEYPTSCYIRMMQNSDINFDRHYRTIEDFAYMVAVINSMAPALPDEFCANPKRHFAADTAKVYYVPGMSEVRVESVAELGAFQLKIQGEVIPSIQLNGMTLDYNYDGEGFTNIFIYSLDGNALPYYFVVGWTGEGSLFYRQMATYQNEYVISKIMVPTAVESDAEDGLPVRYALHQNYPNPFNPNTRISFDLPEASEVSLQIYNVLGRLVRTVHTGSMVAGSHTLNWDGKNQTGRAVTSGIYLYRLEAGEFVATRKMLLLK